ncbi:MAG TPA: 30S ribosomal protein S18 [Candidatus Moranbacteria bacterium]|jgi:small subunit ribosomal protein S18|nr:MAG: 30S ribosomal protein S18 [Parcubacteria group bacterium GW2011_GWC1_36_108]KKQ00416.1 MAG: 30S ribosomal protein S18 [Candidatus Moranbacteria bacterium GW2011_GWD1_36_198]KKQ01628.1 MAG: 30S ribosomal protein S18 [Candidatus Moranbacteria bacterium GW2011_GWD2_36_198]KKQ40366.1 MAG: 30S ribosomal protein S18 [Candidatus Moranbacteria bacterium GW2011_GWC2_37_73]KKQ51359.1 MAG: 30S ribosomal protein S18 [Parcubacteria group bacterium GW2011_GWD2_38_11]MDD5464026.1 30S ribosomal protei
MERKQCYFCDEKMDKIDYKDAYLIRRFMNSQGKIYPPKRHGICTKHQRTLAQAIKRARVMALAPFVVK